MSLIKYDRETGRELPVVREVDGVTFTATNKTRMIEIEIDGVKREIPWKAFSKVSNVLESISVGGAHIIISEHPHQTDPNIKLVGFDELPDPDGSAVALLEKAPAALLNTFHWKYTRKMEKRIAKLEKKLAEAKAGK